MSEVNLETKDRILAAATALFARKGYKGTSVRDIVRETGINISMISYYFQGKQGILKAILQKTIDDFEALACDSPAFDDNEELLELLKKLQGFIFSHSDESTILLDKFNRNIEELEMLFPVIEGRVKSIIKYLSEVGKLAREESTESAYLLTEIWMGMIFSGHLLGISEIMKEEMPSSGKDLDRKRQKLVLLITEFILQHKEELIAKLNEK